MKWFYKQPRDLKKLYLDRNENLSLNLKRHVSELITNTDFSCNLYPDNLYNLNTHISNHLEVNPEEIVLTNGSEEALSIIFNFCSRNFDAVVKWEPTFALINTILLNYDIKCINLCYKLVGNSYWFDYSSIKDLRGNKYIFYISSPNSPTGSIFCKSMLTLLVQTFKDSLFILDGAYIEYAHDYYLDLYKRNKNIVLVRTFSKAWGLAGLRAGYFVTNNPVLQNFRPNYAPNVVAAAILNKMYTKPFLFISSIQETINTKIDLEGFLKRSGIYFIKGTGNFIVIELDERKTKQLTDIAIVKTVTINKEKFIKLSIPDYTSLKQMYNALSC
jgi:histidinol-phosphate aminotransferase